MIEQKFLDIIARQIHARTEQVAAAVAFFDKGATIPFVARYRKDATGNLNEIQLEHIEERNNYFIALSNRRDAILDNVEKQGKLSEELREKILAAHDQTTLEDLYLPFKKQRRTKASVARERGLEPLADHISAQAPSVQSLESFAAQFVKPEASISSPEEALDGARHILAERVSVDPDARYICRSRLLEEGKLVSRATKLSESSKTKFEPYYDFTEPLKTIPSHRLLAVLRGSRLGALRLDLVIDDDAVLEELLGRYLTAPGTPYEVEIRAAVKDAYHRLLRPSMENEVMGLAREKADEEAIQVFRENAHSLLMAPPAGRIPVMGIDPGQLSGCKLAVVDDTGTLLDTATVFPTPPQNDTETAEAVINALIDKHGVKGIAIGNGTGSREVGRFVADLLKKRSSNGVFSVLVNEAGASVYSASKIAREEFPDLDVTIRGAVSIARRLQDPLAELVKLDPRAIGVGQYQHDVNQKRLREGLYRTVESCVNQIGVELNTASAALLRYVAGIQPATADNIIAYRKERGGFSKRAQLLEVSGIGEKTFQQCVGFMRITGGEEALDATAIHPEAYPVVERIAAAGGVAVKDAIRNPDLLNRLNLPDFVTEEVGLLALEDIKHELLKPGRDPRREFRVPKFLDGVHDLAQLQEGAETEGVVTNVTDFGAFVDIGVHQDGLVHLSEMANRYVRDPREIVQVGDIVRVKVLKVDKTASRISLSMKALFAPRPPRPARRPSAEDQPPRDASQRRDEGQRHAPPEEHREQRPPRQASDHRTRPPFRNDANQPHGAHPAPPGRSSKKRRAEKKRMKMPQRSGAPTQRSDEQMNTLLADQLAALRDRFK